MHRMAGAAGALTAVAAISALTAADSGAGATTGSGTAAGSTDRPESCAGLVARVVPLPGAAMGTRYWDLVVTNHGKTVCTLPASPGLAFAGADHRRQSVHVDTDPDARPYRLAAGASAAMVIRYGSDYDPPCHGPIASVRVTPPGTEQPFDVAQNCEQGGASETPWVAGTYAAPS